MKRLVHCAAILLAATYSAHTVSAFCGFYVTKADTKLFNRASKVVLVRDGDRTVLTMANDFRGDPREFAIVIPVPTLLEEDQTHVSDRTLIDHLDAYSAPRLVEYFDENPCVVRLLERMPRSDLSARVEQGSASVRNRSLGVTVEAEYTIGEYDIVILSADQSNGLETWLLREWVPHPVRRVERTRQLHQARYAVLRRAGQSRGAVQARLLLLATTPGRLRVAEIHVADPPRHGQRRRPAGPVRVRPDPQGTHRDDELSDREAADRDGVTGVPQGSSGVRPLLSGTCSRPRSSRTTDGPSSWSTPGI